MFYTNLCIFSGRKKVKDMYEIEEMLNRANFSDNAHFLILKIILSFLNTPLRRSRRPTPPETSATQ